LKVQGKSSFKDLGFAKPEPHRIHRQGFPEAIYCPGKTEQQIQRIFKELLTGNGPVIATRIDPSVAKTLLAEFSGAQHYETARLVVAKPKKRQVGKPIFVLTGGTADIPVAEEAAVTAESLGRAVLRLYDVGVAGIHRLIAHQQKLSKAAAVIVCAGMEGALASVVGGLVSCPVIAVPTSVGYGAHFQGVAPLLTMLNSCASNVSVVNIDNGFGSGVIASLIVRDR
jgi:NCAIR mutase (PurE)-related protein